MGLASVIDVEEGKCKRRELKELKELQPDNGDGARWAWFKPKQEICIPWES